MEVNPHPTPRTEFWQDKFDKKDLPKEKISEIFFDTIEYFKKEQKEDKDEGKKDV